MKLAGQAYGQGTSYYYTENIPVSIRNGAIYANRLFQLYTRLIDQMEKPRPETLTVVEYGAGLGGLSWHFLNLLRDHRNDLYQRTVVWITDSNEDVIRTLSTLPLFISHGRAVRFKVWDAASASPFPGGPVIFAYSAYLIDAFDAVMIECRDNAVYEIKVETTLKPDATLLDAAVFPPSELDSPRIKDLLLAATPEHPVRLPQLVQTINQTYVTVPLAPSPAAEKPAAPEGQGSPEPFPLIAHLSRPGEKNLLTDEAIAEFRDFIRRTVTPARPVRFNWHPRAADHIRQVLASLHPQGLYVLSDFGFVGRFEYPDPEHLTAFYGVSAFTSVCFPHLIHVAQTKNASVVITERELDQTQEMLLSRSDAPSSVIRYFNSVRDTVGYEAVSEAINRLSGDNDVVLPKSLWQEFNKLSQFERQDYYLLKTLATMLFMAGFPDDALKMTQLFRDTFGEFAVEAHLIAGWIYQQKNEHREAITRFKEALLLAPNDASVHSSVGLSYMKLNRFNDALLSFRKAVYCSRTPADIINQLKALGIVYEKLEDWKKAHKLYQHIISYTHHLSDEQRLYFKKKIINLKKQQKIDTKKE